MNFIFVALEFTDSDGNKYPRECTLAGETIEVIMEQFLEYCLDELRTDGLMLNSVIEIRRL